MTSAPRYSVPSVQNDTAITIAVRDLHKSYQMGAQTVHALRGVNLTIRTGTPWDCLSRARP